MNAFSQYGSWRGFMPRPSLPSINFDEIRASNPVSSVAGAVVKLKRAGNEWKACCPFHDERSASFTIFAGDRRFHCFGCGAGGDVLDFIRGLHGVGLRDAAEMLCGGELPSVELRPLPAKVDDDRDTTAEALGIWNSAAPAPGTPVEAYLRFRGIVVPPPPALRFASLSYGRRGALHPVMIALIVAADGRPVGIQRTYLASDGRGKADVPKAKLSLGTIRGAAIRLGEAVDEVMIAEGIEDALSLQQLAGRPAWAAAGASNMPGIILPANIRSVIIGRDNDEAGQREANKATQSFSDQGASVRIVRPADGFKDFNAEIQGADHGISSI